MNMANKIGPSKFLLPKTMFLGLTLMATLTSCSGAPATQLPTVASTQIVTEAPTEAAPTQAQGGTLTLLYFQAPTIVNPHLSPGTKDLSASRITYEPLASFDKDSNLTPFLAAEAPRLENGQTAADCTSVTWKLNHDRQWACGEPFSADDVLFTYQYIMSPVVKS